MTNKKRPLKSLTEEEYKTLKGMGMLWEIYPEASGVYVVDCIKAFNSGDSK